MSEEDRLRFDRRVASLFDELSELAPQVRRERLEALEEREPEVRAALEDLLARDADPGASFLDSPIVLPRLTHVGRRIGPYELRELLGEGGTGRVYQADRVDGGFDQRVAIKVLRTDLASPLARRRFRSERQILAGLEHPGIARMLDGGTSEDGLRYVVLELVEGPTLIEYCDDRELDLESRLRLFQRICDAVHYAHRRLVVHRDLKPGNILVTPEGQPKLLDFGIAKLMEPATEEDRTETEYRALTPAYASPEQLTGRPVTTASDIYSLGVILYELISGLRPYRRGTDTPAQLADRLEQDPPPAPSRALERTDGERATRIAGRRGLARHEHRQRLAGDLDRIVGKAMTNDPEERYGSALQLSEDLDRFLAGHPVIARSPDWAYHWGKFLRRHRLVLGLSGLALALLVGFTVSTVLQARALERQRDSAEAARSEALRERDRAEAVTRFLQDSFVLADPGETQGEALTARAVLSAGASRVRSHFATRPDLQATLLTSLADVHIGLGHYDEAGVLASDAVALRRELEDRETLAQALEILGTARLFEQEFAAAEATFEESYELWQTLEGGEGPGAAMSLYYLAYLHQAYQRQAEAETTARRALELLELRPHPSDDVSSRLADGRYLLGQVLTSSENPEEAEAHLQRALEDYQRLGAGFERKAAATLHALGKLYHQLGRSTEADETIAAAIERSRSVLGDHPQVANELISWATALRERGEWDRAERSLREAVGIYRRAGDGRGDDDLVVAGLVHLGHFFLQKPDLVAAEPPLTEALERSRGSLDADDSRLGSLINNLVSLYVRRGDHRRAEPLCEEVVPLRRRQLTQGVDGRQRLEVGLANSLLLCGEVQASLGRTERARREVEEARATFETAGVLWRRAAADSLLGAILAQQGDRDAAEPLLRSGLEELKRLRPGSHYEEAARRRLRDTGFVASEPGA